MPACNSKKVSDISRTTHPSFTSWRPSRQLHARKEGRVTLALLEPNLIVGYGTCWYPDPDDRWSALGELMYEMGAVEVSRNFRSLQLAESHTGGHPE